VLVEPLIPLASPIWFHSQLRSGSDTDLNVLTSFLYFESMICHYSDLNRTILWAMVIRNSSLVILLMVGIANHPSCGFGQIFWVPYKILYLMSHSLMNLHCHHPTTAFMAIYYSGDQIVHSESMVISAQYISRFGRMLARSRGNLSIQCMETKTKDSAAYSRHSPGVLLPLFHCAFPLCVLVRFMVWQLYCWVYIGALLLCATPPSLPPCLPCWKLSPLMSNLSPRAPLSFDSDSNGSSSELQNDGSISHHFAQPLGTTVLAGSGPNHSAQPTEPIRPTFSDTLKFGVGSYGSGSQPTVESKPGLQPRPSEFVGVFLKGGSSHQLPPQSLSGTPLPNHSVSNSLETFVSCCLLGKVWGESVPLPAIIHRTKNNWKFVKGQLEYVDLGNDWILLRFANCQDKLMVYNERP